MKVTWAGVVEKEKRQLISKDEMSVSPSSSIRHVPVETGNERQESEMFP